MGFGRYEQQKLSKVLYERVDISVIISVRHRVTSGKGSIYGLIYLVHMCVHAI